MTSINPFSSGASGEGAPALRIFAHAGDLWQGTAVRQHHGTSSTDDGVVDGGSIGFMVRYGADMYGLYRGYMRFLLAYIIWVI